MAITGRQAALRKLAKGQGLLFPVRCTIAASNITAAAAASGYFTTQIQPNSIGTTLPGTVQGFAFPAGLPASLSALIQFSPNFGGMNVGYFLAWLYKIGTVDLTLTGNQFTHDAATFPVTRTQLGVAAQPLTLLPLVQITTATATTAPAFLIRNNSGPAAGYTDQDGNGVIGTTTFTFPAAATAVNSCFIPRLEQGDSGIRDISQIDVQTAGSAGAATLWGMEILCPLAGMAGHASAPYDSFFNGFGPNSLNPAAPTSGSLTSALCLVSLGSITGGSVAAAGFLEGVLA